MRSKCLICEHCQFSELYNRHFCHKEHSDLFRTEECNDYEGIYLLDPELGADNFLEDDAVKEKK